MTFILSSRATANASHHYQNKKKGALALFFDALFSSFANLSLKKRKHAAGAALVLAPGITLDAEKDRFVTLSWVVEWVFFSPQLVLQGDDKVVSSIFRKMVCRLWHE